MRLFIKRHKKMSIVLVSLVSLFLIFDLAMAVLAWREYQSGLLAGQQYPWSFASQEIEPVHVRASHSVILLHGYMGSPFDFKMLAIRLRDAGFRVVIPAIPGQNRKTSVYKRGEFTPKFYQDWLAQIVKQETERFGQKPYLLGFSMGGALATVVSAENTVAKLVLLAPFYALPHANNLVEKIAGWVSWVLPVVPKLSKARINDAKGYAEYIPGSLLVSLDAFVQLHHMAVAAQEKVARITVPVLILASPNDQVASFAKTQELAATPNIQLRQFPRSNHVLLYDYDREPICQAILQFFLEK
jgi:esterase/lipase